MHVAVGIRLCRLSLHRSRWSRGAKLNDCLADMLINSTQEAEQLLRHVNVCAIRAIRSGGCQRLAWGEQCLRAVKTIVLSVEDVNKEIPAAIYRPAGWGERRGKERSGKESGMSGEVARLRNSGRWPRLDSCQPGRRIALCPMLDVLLRKVCNGIPLHCM